MKLTENFSLAKFRCNDSKGSPVPSELLANVSELARNLQALHDHLGEPLHITSAYRTPAHNAAIGGEKNSFHMKAMAADLTTKSKSPRQLHTIIEKLIADGKMKQGGLGLYRGFVHYDVRGVKARWNG